MHRSESDEEILDTFFEGQARADSWQALREALQARLQDVLAERAALPEGDSRRSALGRKIAEMRQQVEALRQEEIVSRFVEDSVRATLARPEPAPGEDDDDGGPY